jgi:hypothetical protein
VVCFSLFAALLIRAGGKHKKACTTNPDATMSLAGH